MSQMLSRRRGSEGAPVAAGPILALLAFASLITALDFTIVYVALPEIARDVGFSDHALQWVMSAYAIAYGGLLLLGGRLSDAIGRRRMFVVGLALFGGASLLGGLASAQAPLVAARVLQGIGAAVLFPATLSLVSSTFAEGRVRNRAMTVWASAGAVGLSLGALLGGVLTELTGWQGVFFVNVPLVGVALVASVSLLPADAPRAGGGRLDLSGAVTATAGASLLVFAIAQAPERGWTDAGVLVAAMVAVALLASFLAIEGRAREPLMPLRLLRSRALVGALGVIFAFGATLQAMPYFLTLYLQDELGFTALQGGLAFLAPTLAITAGNLVADRLVARAGVRRTLVAGMIVGAAGAALLGTLMAGGGSYGEILAGVVLTGLGMGLVYPPMFIAAAAGVAPSEHGTASGMASTALQVGASVGLAVLVAVAASGGLSAAMLVVGAGAVVGSLTALALPRGVAPGPGPVVEAPAAAAGQG